MCRNSHKLKTTLATVSCSEGDFGKGGVLTHPPNLRMFIFNGLHNPKIMRTFEPKMLADRYRTTADSFQGLKRDGCKAEISESTDIEEEITLGS